MISNDILYSRLELNEDATIEDIKKSYNRLSKKLHPDKNINNIKDATTKFQELTEAKNILLKLKENDTLIYKKIINENIIENIYVKLEQLYYFNDINFKYKKKIYCSHCNSYGTIDGKPSECNACYGKGMIIEKKIINSIIQEIIKSCNNCDGNGKFIKADCSYCNGNGYNFKEKNIIIPLKPGLSSGNKIILTGKGHIFKNIKSDLILIVNELSHNFYKRINNDLIININLELYEALIGFNKIITLLDNTQININYTGITEYGTIKIIDNYGMPILNTNNKGNLIIYFYFTLPKINTEYYSHLKILCNYNENVIINNNIINIILK
jgi:DnaJ-class molecular chaperone